MRLLYLPLITLAMASGAALMLVPAAHALAGGDHATARAFFYSAAMTGFLTLLVALATRGRGPARTARDQLVALFVVYGVLPILLALPFAAVMPEATLPGAWFEMVSSITTTGATLWDRAGDLNLSLHLWRGLVGWFGGLVAWAAAIAILAPLNLGGYEMRVRAALPPVAQANIVTPAELFARHAARLVPVYAGLTALLWLGLVVAGAGATEGAIHAMGVISTSGITPLPHTNLAAGGFGGEVVILAFFVFALSRATFARSRTAPPLWRDSELRLGLRLVLAVTVIVGLRALWLVHGHGGGMADGLRALWGIFFTTASFLTTTGIESRWWPEVWHMSQVPAPGLVLVALALVGGGVGTAAGGVKLLRMHAVLAHAGRETVRMIEPASVARGGVRRGAVMAWTFFALFALSALVVMAMLSLAPGMQFEQALLVSLAAITTTGQLVMMVPDAPVSFSGLTQAAQIIAALGMILGRLEVLALIALFNPDFWHR